MPQFEIKDYAVNTARTQGPSGPQPVLWVRISSGLLAGDIRHQANLNFRESPPTNLGWVTNVDQPNFRGYFLSTEWSKSDFAQFYDVLRSERPLYFSFAYTPSGYNPADPTRDLTISWLYTGPEPLGEGPAEMLPGVSSSEMQFALSNAGETGSTDASGRGRVQD